MDSKSSETGKAEQMSLSEDEGSKPLYIPESESSSCLTPSVISDSDNGQRELDFEFQAAEKSASSDNSHPGKPSAVTPIPGKSDTESDKEMDQLHSNLSAFVAARDAKSRAPVSVPSVAGDGNDKEKDAAAAAAQDNISTAGVEKVDPGRPMSKNALIFASGNLALQKSVPDHDNCIAASAVKAHMLYQLAKGTQHDRNARIAIQSCNFLPGLDPITGKLDDDVIFLIQNSSEMGHGPQLHPTGKLAGKTGFNLQRWTDAATKFPLKVTVKTPAGGQVTLFSILASGNVTLRKLGQILLAQCLSLEDCEVKKYASKGIDNFVFACDLNQSNNPQDLVKETALVMVDSITENVGDVSLSNNFTKLKFQQYTDGSIANLDRLALGSDFSPPLKPACTISQWLVGGLCYAPTCYKNNPKGRFSINLSMFIQTR